MMTHSDEKKMKVGQFMLLEGVDIGWIEQFMDDTEYWKKCDKFLRSVWTLPIMFLSEKQFKWLKSIKEDCSEKRIER